MPPSTVIVPQYSIGRVKVLLADASLVLTFVSVVALFVISEALLDKLGLHYSRPGGLPFEKVHPGTLFAAIALTARLASSERPMEPARNILRRETALLFYLLAVAIAAFHAVVVTGNPVTGLGDTFVLPALMVVLVGDLQTRFRRQLAIVICLCVALNACVGLAEFLFQWRLTPVDLPEGPYDETDYRFQASIDWRSTALLGHPLQNASVTGAFILCIASPGARWMPAYLRIILAVLCLMSMAAFGGRASLVLTLLGLVASALISAVRHVMSGRGLPRRSLVAALIAAPVLFAIPFLIGGSGLFDKTIERFVDDAGSAKARYVMWDMFDVLSWPAILFGPDPDVVRTQQHLLGIDLGIESFWVAMTLYYGLIVACGLFIGLALLSRRLISPSRPGATIVLLFFIAVVSTSTGLSSKTTGLALVTSMIFAILDRPPRSLPISQRPGSR